MKKLNIEDVRTTVYIAETEDDVDEWHLEEAILWMKHTVPETDGPLTKVIVSSGNVEVTVRRTPALCDMSKAQLDVVRR